MDLMHNTAFRILHGDDQGLYRVILDEISLQKIAVVRLDPPPSPARGGRKRLVQTKNPRKKNPSPMIGDIQWMDRESLRCLTEGEDILLIQIELENFTSSPSDQAIFEHRKKMMAPFLVFDHFRKMVLAYNGISGLVNEAVALGCSSAFARKNFSLLCRYGFVEASLKPTRSLRCGAPGIPRPCDPDGRKKAGAKTRKQRNARAFGEDIDSEQPGMSSVWASAILAADRRIPTPKPPMPERVTRILETFAQRYRQIDGQLVAVEMKLGEYPNKRQVKRVLERSIPRMQKLLERTTKGHFLRSLRGLTGRNWKGVVGPGHTWAIDSTIADIYLRSSVNRAWIIGRPIVYVIVDIWSTAVVGFFVCLNGPSWDMAKAALFSAVANPQLLGDLWGFEATSSLFPAPTMCTVLMCDRGEYLSQAARITGAKLIPCLSYAPPYRPDLKGLVEVLHRIKKNQQYFFVPGAIDQRRKEYELRRFDPHDAVMTIPEYVAYLHQLFTVYNLTAPREDRLDVYMRSAGVFPSPAGLWRYGHEVGIGVRRDLPQQELITELLPSEKAHVTRNAVRFLGMEFCSDEIEERQWTAIARNFGSWDIQAHYFPGSVSRIWTPDPTSSGLLELRLSDHSVASPELTVQEFLDAFVHGKIDSTEKAHVKLMIALTARQKMIDILEKSKVFTAEADSKHSGKLPSITEARSFEAATLVTPATSPEIPVPDQEQIRSSYLDMMSAIFAASNEG